MSATVEHTPTPEAIASGIIAWAYSNKNVTDGVLEVRIAQAIRDYHRQQSEQLVEALQNFMAENGHTFSCNRTTNVQRLGCLRSCMLARSALASATGEK